MCLGVPFQVQEASDFGVARCAAITGEERLVQTLLLEATPVPGEWLLVHIDTAVQPLTAAEAEQTNRALLALGDATSEAALTRQEPAAAQIASVLKGDPVS